MLQSHHSGIERSVGREHADDSNHSCNRTIVGLKVRIGYDDCHLISALQSHHSGIESAHQFSVTQVGSHSCNRTIVGLKVSLLIHLLLDKKGCNRTIVGLKASQSSYRLG